MIADLLLPEFDVEMANTRKSLERVPVDRLGFKPHEKSPVLGWLAGHLANIPTWTDSILGAESFDVAPLGQPRPRPSMPDTVQQVLDQFDANVARARAAIAEAPDEKFSTTWSLLAGGQTIFTLPRYTVLRRMVLNHTIHHRAQLGIYLRLNGVPVPAIYGPSADEAL